MIRNQKNVIVPWVSDWCQWLITYMSPMHVEIEFVHLYSLSPHIGLDFQTVFLELPNHIRRVKHHRSVWMGRNNTMTFQVWKINLHAFVFVVFIMATTYINTKLTAYTHTWFVSAWLMFTVCWIHQSGTNMGNWSIAVPFISWWYTILIKRLVAFSVHMHTYTAITDTCVY
jgi:hypothetical protein